MRNKQDVANSILATCWLLSASQVDSMCRKRDHSLRLTHTSHAETRVCHSTASRCGQAPNSCVFMCAGVIDRCWSAWLLRGDRFYKRCNGQVWSVEEIPGMLRLAWQHVLGPRRIYIKVTVGGAREGGGQGAFFAEFPLKNTGLFGFYVCNTRVEFPSAEGERVPEPPKSQESTQTNIDRKWRVCRQKDQREEFRVPPLEDAFLSLCGFTSLTLDLFIVCIMTSSYPSTLSSFRF